MKVIIIYITLDLSKSYPWEYKKVFRINVINMYYSFRLTSHRLGLPDEILLQCNIDLNYIIIMDKVVSHSLEKGTEKYYGTKSYMSVYNVSLSFDQSSSTNIWIVGGPVDSLGVLMTGWLVKFKTPLVFLFLCKISM